MGLVRDIVLTGLLGAGVALDAFVVMMKIPSVFRRLFAEGAFNQAFIPVLAEYKENNSPEETKDLINFTFGALSSVLLCVTIDLKDEVSKECAPTVSLIDQPVKIVASRLGDRFRVAGTAELAGLNTDIKQDRIRPLLHWIEKYFPKVSTETYTPWAGLRPMTPNMMPITKESKMKGVFYHTGHGHLGWTLSAQTAKIVADKIDSI